MIARCGHTEPIPTRPTVLLVSYSTGMPGFSPSEWVDDKLQAARVAGQFVVLVTSVSSKLVSCPHQEVFKVASISKSDFIVEQSQCVNMGVRLPVWQKFRAATLGAIFDTVFSSLAGSRSDGRWSWVLTSVPVILRAYLKFKPQSFVATGGPSAAQFAACIASFAPLVRPPTLELQDPFIGLEMNLSARTLGAMEWMNRFMLTRSKKYVAVSSGSLQRLVARYPQHESKLEAIYPYASPKVREPGNPAGSEDRTSFEFLHAGTLYGSRTLKPLFSALDDAYDKGLLSKGQVLVTNLGADYSGSLERFDYEQTPAVSRQDAVHRSSRADCLLLVQHSDSRSLETIPFKLYDYLNLSVPILVLGRNPEIRTLLSDSDFFVDIDDHHGLMFALAGLVRERNPARAIEGRPSPEAYISSWSKLTS